MEDYPINLNIKHNDYLIGNKNILYDKILSNDLNGIKKIIKNDDLIIGRPILNYQDIQGFIPLHYSILNNDLLIFTYLLSKTTKDALLLETKKGLNILYYAIENNNNKITNLLINKYIDLNLDLTIIDKNGNTPLHYACIKQNYEIAKLLIINGIDINISNFINDFSALNYCVLYGNLNLLKLLIQYGANIDDQDYYGNTILHYSLIYNKYEIFKYLITFKNINFNKYNIDSELPIHLYLNKYSDNLDLKILIKNSLINFRNKKGETPFYLIVKKGLWKNNIKELSKKKLNIFIKSFSDNKELLSYINAIDMNDFIHMLSLSYIYILRTTNLENLNNWEQICKKINFTILEIKNLENILNIKNEKYDNIDNLNYGNDLCLKNAANYIKKLINDKNNLKSSYLINKNKIKIELEYSKNNDYCTFIGSQFDILCGIFYLIKINNNFVTSPINSNIVTFNKINGLTLNFEIIFKNNELIINNIITSLIIKKKKSVSRFIIISLGIETINSGHSNYIIYDKKKNEIERFEPYGYSNIKGFYYDSNLLDKKLKLYFSSIFDGVKYFAPKDYMDKISFQHFDSIESETKQYGDPGGFCAVWTIWYADMRIKYYKIDRNILIKKLIRNIISNKYSFKNLIRNYSNKITKIRNTLLQKGGININDWINESYTTNQFEIIANIIKNYINMIM